MDRRRARLLALCASTLVAVTIFAVVWARLQGREVESVHMHRVERPIGGVTPARPGPVVDEERSSDPSTPEEWRYFLNEEDANRNFNFRGDARRVYDPWVYMRDAGNLTTEMRWREHPDRKWTWKSNSLGCREDHELDDPPRDLRVLVAGDSHTCGLCNDEESFANVLEASLAREHAGKSVEVLNSGLGGYSFHSYFGTLFRFRSFQPQVFVVGVFGGNDFAELLMLDFEFTHRPWDTMTEQENARRTAALAVSNTAMGQGLNSIDTFRVWSHEEAPMVRAAVELCSEMRRVAERHGTKLIVVLIPSPFEFHWNEVPKQLSDTRAALELSDEDMKISRRMGTSFLDGLREADVQSLDMGPIFEREPNPPYWRTDFHLNLRGHALIAEALQPLVDKALAAADK